MNKTYDDYLKEFKKDLDKGNNFVDYFIVIGIDKELIFSDYLYENDINKLNNSSRINPKILSKFPPIEKTMIGLDETIIKVINVII